MHQYKAFISHESGKFNLVFDIETESRDFLEVCEKGDEIIRYIGVKVLNARRTARYYSAIFTPISPQK